MGAAGVDSGHATSNLKQTNILDGEKGDPESGPEAEALMSQQVRIFPSQAALELGSAPTLQPKRSKMDRVRGVRDAAKEGVTRGYTTAKQRVTCTCTKVTWRTIRLCLSLWQIADMVSDGFQTAKFNRLSSVRHERMVSNNS